MLVLGRRSRLLPLALGQIRYVGDDASLAQIYSAHRKWLCVDCGHWFEVASISANNSNVRHLLADDVLANLAQKAARRGNIAKAFAFECANSRRGDDGHSGLTATYVATHWLDLPGFPLPRPCSAGRSSRDPLSSPAFRSDIGTLAGGAAPPALLSVASARFKSPTRGVVFAPIASAACRSLVRKPREG